MAKKASNSEFNMAEAIRDILKENPKLNCKETADAVMAKNPSVRINKNSFSVAYYTGRKKLGIGTTTRRRRFSKRVDRAVAASQATVSATGRPTVDIAMLQTTAKFLSQVGGADVALEAIKYVQAAQLK
jgi:hypothetical protein